ncbi:MAG: translation initiation factor IF-3 [Candidatus Zambryskibacteria bacterium RIFCSPLOWO2_02_FULL_39_26]|uniref:Translation initiation factor IF-3 n=1 Tax=Candidatus Zambryskibacteria bacterium RIFCSPLOWO2_12_FULL_39_23 TaxID=1802776 RepID=A0A1G2USP3_9BACT|nr:MAG: translation initiation factor IF-3 [Candidatus Zambryskibacteria bacterium RIFCSPHIGHO2_02_39_10]OHA99596.1 MAG: translation initiation factor IF-3 [Candidatus Zambryskibacteria bacterium RIFCSPHIGHO2_12_FULL_39_47]OHB10099.1 MAG: translation initiation factor IF-3 [Candidatus Zambryskibacteria bacterium RIFCSPLOWO2_02_FULL_39_26]OHB12414.1 MAG: translation initiation factor IF-3 [Candidatus Zambryskibacteria bacterium RIFCSPLOWO2_12_FULL_39_23]
MSIHVRINNQIQAPELRVIMEDGGNLGVISFKEALDKAREAGLDLIEISPKANPPVAKIMDYGKFQYAENKKQKVAKTKSHTVEIKNIQVKVGTGDHDLELKAKKASGWLKQGNRIKIDLFLPGRTKYMDKKFLRERMDRVLNLITEKYKIADEARSSPKGLSIIIERS